MNYFFLESWHEFLPREEGHLIAFMGSGGKTSLMREVAGQLAREDRSVVMTTTTRTEPLPDVPVVDWDGEADAITAPPRGPFFVRAGILPDGKWRGLTSEAADRLGGVLPGHIVLAEVDGAAKKPLKIPRDGEPVWPRRTSLALVVMGAGAVGSRLGEVVHRFGRQAWPPLEGKEEWALLEWEHVTDLLLAEGGYLDRVPDPVPAVLALLGLAEQDDSIGLFGFTGRAMEDPRLPLVILGDTTGESPALRTACRDDTDPER